MSYSYQSRGGLIVVGVELHGPTGIAIVRLALDTGATRTLINASVLTAAGYELELVNDRVEMTTGSGLEYVPRIAVRRIATLGITRENHLVVGHTLPASAGIDGLLGVDFFAETKLTINFRERTLEID